MDKKLFLQFPKLSMFDTDDWLCQAVLSAGLSLQHKPNMEQNELLLSLLLFCSIGLGIGIPTDFLQARLL